MVYEGPQIRLLRSLQNNLTSIEQSFPERQYISHSHTESFFNLLVHVSIISTLSHTQRIYIFNFTNFTTIRSTFTDQQNNPFSYFTNNRTYLLSSCFVPINIVLIIISCLIFLQHVQVAYRQTISR